MRGSLAGLLRTLILPFGATPAQSRVLIGGDIPSEIVTLYTVTLPALGITGGGTPVATIVGYVGGGSTAYQARVWIKPTTGPIFTTEVVYDGTTIREIVRFRTGTATFGAWTPSGNVTVGPFESGLSPTGFFLTSLPLQFSLNNATQVWTAVTLLNGWTNFGGSDAPAQYQMTPLQSIRLIGTIVPGNKNDGTTIFTLPVGYRPAKNRTMQVWTDVTVAGAAHPRIVIFPNGNVQIFGCNLAGLGALSFENEFSLDAT